MLVLVLVLPPLLLPLPLPRTLHLPLHLPLTPPPLPPPPPPPPPLRALSWLKMHFQCIARHASLRRCVSSTVPVLWCVPTSTGPDAWHIANFDGRGRVANHCQISTPASSTARSRRLTAPDVQKSREAQQPPAPPQLPPIMLW